MRILKGKTREEYPQLLVEQEYVLGAEIGVQDSDHAVYLLERWAGSLLLVDPWRYYVGLKYNDMANTADEAHEIHRQNCLKKLEPFSGRYKVMRMFSHEAAVELDDGSLDFIYLDGNHTYAWVWMDQMIWWDKIRPGGIISGHDYTEDGPPRQGNVYGVKPAILDFCEKMKIDELFISNEEWPTWYYYKPQLSPAGDSWSKK